MEARGQTVKAVGAQLAPPGVALEPDAASHSARLSLVTAGHTRGERLPARAVARIPRRRARRPDAPPVRTPLRGGRGGDRAAVQGHPGCLGPLRRCGRGDGSPAAAARARDLARERAHRREDGSCQARAHRTTCTRWRAVRSPRQAVSTRPTWSSMRSPASASTCSTSNAGSTSAAPRVACVRVLAAAYPEDRVARLRSRTGPRSRGHARTCPAIDFFVSGDAPPLPLADGSLDLAYAISIWSHFAPELGLRWFEEMHRVIRPGGHLVCTTHGLTSVALLRAALACARRAVERDRSTRSTAGLVVRARVRRGGRLGRGQPRLGHGVPLARVDAHATLPALACS